MMISWWSKHLEVILSVLMYDNWINVLLQTSALVGPLHVVSIIQFWKFLCLDHIPYMARIRITRTERHSFQVPTYHELSPQKFCLRVFLFFPSSDGSPAREHSNLIVLSTQITPDVYKSHSLRNFSVFTFSIHLMFTSYYHKFFYIPDSYPASQEIPWHWEVWRFITVISKVH
jgi:hypothetical protein